MDNNKKLLTPDELFVASQEASQRAQFEKTRGDRLAEKLRALGVDPDGEI